MSHLRSAFFHAAPLALALAGCTHGSGAGIPLQNDCTEACKTLFSESLGGANWSHVTQIGTDAAGNVVLSGRVSGASSLLGLDGAQGDVWFLAKLDPEGHLVWEEPFPGGGSSLLQVNAAGHVFLAGTTAANQAVDLGDAPLAPASAGGVMYVAEIDPDGHLLWSRTVADLYQPPDGEDEDGNHFVAPNALALDPSGAIVVAGSFMGPLDLGGGDLGFPQNPFATCAFVVKLDAAGQHVWSQRFGSQPDGNTMNLDTSLFLHGATVDGEGSIVLSGELFGALHVGGEVVTSHGNSDAFVAKIDASGGYVFARAMGGLDGDSALGVAIAPDGAILFTGFTSGAVDFGEGPLAATSNGNSPFVAALEPDGDLRFAARVPSLGAASGYGERIGADAQGNVIAMLGTSDAVMSISVVKLEPSRGQTIHATTYAVSDPLDLDATLNLDTFALDPIGNALIGGGFRGIVDFGQGPLSVDMTAWGQSAVLAKVAP